MSELHDRVTRNLRVLMAVRGMDGYAPLAQTLDIDKASVSNKMRGRRPWSLDDLEKIAHLFHIEPASLVGDGHDLLDPNPLRATGTTGGPSTTVLGDVTTSVIPFPQVAASSAVHPTLATVIPLQRANRDVHPRHSRTVAV